LGYLVTEPMHARTHPGVSTVNGTLRCLYISRYAPVRTQTDPYTGLPWYLSQQTSLRGIWNKPERGSVPFREACEEVTEVSGNVRGWLTKLQCVRATASSATKPDCIVCGIDEHSLSIAVLAGQAAGVPVYAFAEDPPFTTRYSGSPSVGKRIERTLRRRVITALLRRCAGIFCFVEKDALENFHVRGVPLHQMMNSPSGTGLALSAERTPSIGEDGVYVVGLVGALCKEQGLDSLLEIAAKAHERTGNLRLRLIGPIEPSYEEDFREHIRRRGLDSAIEVTGWLPYPMMMEKLSGCSVGVYCNPDTDWYRMAQPLKICEYLALAKPVVAWDYPGTRRLLDAGRLGILVPSGDIPAFVDALVRLRDPVVRAGIEKEIRTATASRWSSTYWYGKTLSIMQKPAGGRKHGHISED
jgi:glycosyltransferase involved in cell wall biosynthesis